MDNKQVKKGDIVEFLPKYKAEGDEQFQWTAIEDSDGDRVKVMALSLKGEYYSFNPIYVVKTNWLK